jgi:flagellar motor protein MotB
VRDYLVSRHGIDPSRITVEARGTQDPVGDNTTAEGRLRNRRVVIRLMVP